MNVWLLKDGENLPVQQNVTRMRTWMLADALLSRGHRVTWWSSTHSHQRKKLLADSDRSIEISDGFFLQLLHAGSYIRNHSVKRILHHRRMASLFLEKANTEREPDVIVSAFPTIELASAAVEYAHARSIPVVVDVRDPWPDVIQAIVPFGFKHVAMASVWPLRSQAKACLKNALSIVACSQGFLEWALALAGRSRTVRDQIFPVGRPDGDDHREPADSDRLRHLFSAVDGKVVATFVGSFGHVYELGIVCEVARDMWCRQETDVHFVLAGDGLQYERIQRRTRDLPNVHLTGWLDSNEVASLLNRSDMAIAPCRQLPGCVPNKVFEYAAAGLPILSSLEGDMEQLLSQHEAGFSYRPGKADELRRAVARLGGSPELRQKMSDNSLNMFRTKFKASTIYRSYVDHIEALASTSR